MRHEIVRTDPTTNQLSADDADCADRGTVNAATYGLNQSLKFFRIFSG